MMAYTVYKITNTVNGKAYIGITARSVADRWAEHATRAREGVRQSRLHSAIRKYGSQSFTREIIATTGSEDAVRALETKFIRELGTYEGGYNCNEGGNGLLVVSPELRKKISDAQRGRAVPAERRAKMSAAKIGRSECAENFGAHTGKGAANPRSRGYLIRFPDGSEKVITGLRAFCRETGVSSGTIRRGHNSLGYRIIHNLPSIDDNAVNAITTEGLV